VAELRRYELDDSDIGLLRWALEHAERQCRYHGSSFGKLGVEPRREADPGGFQRDLPRCDSCKQPYRVTKALDRLDWLTTR
jgi:hypothetical protein